MSEWMKWLYTAGQVLFVLMLILFLGFEFHALKQDCIRDHRGNAEPCKFFR